MKAIHKLLLPCLLSFCCLAYAERGLPFRPLTDQAIPPQETAQLESMFQAARSANAAVQPGPDAGAQRRAIVNELYVELEQFVADHTNSAWNPAIQLYLGQAFQMQSSYNRAMQHYYGTWAAVQGSTNAVARMLGAQAMGKFAKIMALTGKTDDVYALRQELSKLRAVGTTPDWGWCSELSIWKRQYPDLYKCGLCCLNRLGMLTQPGQFDSRAILAVETTPRGLTAEELVDIANRAGLRVRAALWNPTNAVPAPCVIHLASEHFIYVGSKRGAFYEVYDTVALSTRWLTAREISREATGCVIVSDIVLPPADAQLSPMDATTASGYRGREYLPSYLDDHDEHPCPPDTCCPPGGGGGPPQKPDCTKGKCTEKPGVAAAGMPTWFVSEPYVNLWVQDTPLSYQPALGPSVDLQLRYFYRHTPSRVSGYCWHGAQFGNLYGISGLWGCSWLSYAELNGDENMVDLMMPGGTWATFTFTGSSSTSEMEYFHNAWAEKQGTYGAITNLVVHYPDGTQASYGVRDANVEWAGTLFYISSLSDAAGHATTFAYDGDLLLTNVTAADGTAFTLNYTNVASYITSVSSSYGASAYFYYGEFGERLEGITDAAGISSQFGYDDCYECFLPMLDSITTPYGTTQFTFGFGGTLQRTVRIYRPDGKQEMYGLIYGPVEGWPDFQSSQIPANTPVGTLDTAARSERNTVYWNAQQFASYTNLDVSQFTWSECKNGRIRHWLLSLEQTYGWDYSTLSLEQAASPDGGTTEGQITWYDYAGKASNQNHQQGTQIWPSVTARVMPDETTWYTYSEYNSLGKATNVIEKWDASGTARYRTNQYIYAANGLDLLAHINASGVLVSSNVFNAYHQVTTNYDALEQPTYYQYDSTTHLLTQQITPTGLTNSYSYNSTTHRLESETAQPINRTRSYTWYSNGNLESFTDERGMTVTNFWDALNRLTGTRYPDGTTTTNLYTVGGTNILDVTATKDRENHWTYFGYDEMRRKYAETNANGIITRYGFCDCDAVSEIMRAWNTSLEQTTSFDYDRQGNRIHTTDADGNIVTNWFDSLGRLATTCDAIGCRWFGYDNLNRRTSITNGLGAVESSIVYDIEDRPLYVTDANGVTVTNSYDDLGRLLTRTYPDAGVEKFEYSARGLVTYTNQLTNVTHYVYDAAGRKTYETNANNELIQFIYNSAGDLRTLTDGKNQTTTWNYDEYGRVTNKLDQASVEILRYKYDADNRLTNRWSAAKGETKYRYDAIGNLTNVDYPNSTDLSFAYDALSRLTNMVDASGTSSYSYTTAGRLLSEDGPFANDTLTNIYSNGLRTGFSLQQPTGSWTNGFSYDAAKRLTNVTSSAGSFGYAFLSEASLLPRKIALPNTAYITNTYDNVARLTGTYLNSNNDVTLDAAIYGYNVGNQRRAATNAAGAYVSYTYDSIGQLKVADSVTNSEDRGYTYDAAWNLNYRTNNTWLHTFWVNEKNELTNSTVWNGMTYDANGNRTEGDGGCVVYDYDDENQLAFFEGSGEVRSYFTYDGKGRLRKRLEYSYDYDIENWILTEETRYVYDGMRVIQERSSSTPLVAYTRGNDLSGSPEGAGGIGGLLARSHGYSSGNWGTHNFYHADGNGNITAMLNSSQAVAARYRYDPFGNSLGRSGTLAEVNKYRFSSKEYHDTTALYYYGYRWYEPYQQRWLNRDPLGDGASLMILAPKTQPRTITVADVLNMLVPQPFEKRDGANIQEFVFNNPINLVDVLGLDCWDDFQACMSVKNVCMAIVGGSVPGALGGGILGGYAGAGPHVGPAGNPRPVWRGGGPTTYGRGLGRSVGGGLVGGATFGLLAQEAACYGALAGCLSGSSDSGPNPPNSPPCPDCF